MKNLKKKKLNVKIQFKIINIYENYTYSLFLNEKSIIYEYVNNFTEIFIFNNKV